MATISALPYVCMMAHVQKVSKILHLASVFFRRYSSKHVVLRRRPALQQPPAQPLTLPPPPVPLPPRLPHPRHGPPNPRGQKGPFQALPLLLGPNAHITINNSNNNSLPSPSKCLHRHVYPLPLVIIPLFYIIHIISPLQFKKPHRQPVVLHRFLSICHHHCLSQITPHRHCQLRITPWIQQITHHIVILYPRTITIYISVIHQYPHHPTVYYVTIVSPRHYATCPLAPEEVDTVVVREVIGMRKDGYSTHYHA